MHLLDRVAVSVGCCLDSRFVQAVSVVELLEGVRAQYRLSCYQFVHLSTNKKKRYLHNLSYLK